MYVDILRLMKKKVFFPVWIRTELFELQSKVLEFKTVQQKLFANYQASGMRTQKWHFYDHLSYSTMYKARF